MTDSSVTNINGIGAVLFQKSKRAKRVIISIRTSRDIRVAVPTRTSYKKAREFVDSKKQWMQKHLAVIRENEKQQKALEDSFLDIDRADAEKRLKDRLAVLAKKHGLTYNKVSIRKQKTRWGSCSSNKNISLNIKLAALPEELIDYVIMHELVHTRVHDHSRKFWAMLDRYNGNAKEKAKKLKKHDSMLL
jgi:predicted metal-dependent hydrolase